MAPIPPAAAAAAAAQTCDAKAMSAKWTELNELAAAAKKREKKLHKVVLTAEPTCSNARLQSSDSWTIIIFRFFQIGGADGEA